MYIVMGGTGHVGSATAQALLQHGVPVRVLTRRAAHASHLAGQGAQVVEADVNDVDALRATFRLGRRAFLLNPPADVALDTDVVERGTVDNILAALVGSGLEKVVVESTGGAQPGERLGDLSVLWHLEQGLCGPSPAAAIPAAINRAGYYMSNWDAQLEAVRDTGRLQTMFPREVAVPMVAPRDLGAIAAARLMSAVDDIGVKAVEGPRRYSSADVARAFSKALGRPVEVVVTPRDQWHAAFRSLGFSEAAADAYTRMTAASVDSAFHTADDPVRGTMSLDEYLAALVRDNPVKPA